MKTKDEIIEAEMYSILRKHKLPLKKREDLMVDLTDFTHSQLKEQQEEIERLRGCKITQRQSDRIEQLKAETKDLDSQLTASMELVRKRYDELQSKQKEIDELSEILERVNYMISLNQKIKSNGEFHNKVKQLLKPPCTTSTYGDLGSNK
jgi:DNA repair exonuclease SbcCD ATPase subunit